MYGRKKMIFLCHPKSCNNSKKINLMKKDVLASKKSKEAEKQLKTKVLQRPCSVQLERIAGISSIFGQHLQRRSTPTEKEPIKDLVRMIKREPEENTNKAAAPGIRMLLEKTHRRRCVFFFFQFVCLLKIYFFKVCCCTHPRSLA